MSNICILQEGDTALISAAAAGHDECARLLLQGGAKGVKDQVRRLTLHLKMQILQTCLVESANTCG